MEDYIKAGVIGYPITHSKSPLIHNYWIKKHDLKGAYTALEIPAGHLREQMNELIAEGYSGFNLTVPHKVQVMEYLDEIEQTAQAIGAVNTVFIRDGKKIGKNTDAYGFIENIKLSHPETDFTDKTAIVLGAGGAARAAVYGLLDQGVRDIRVLNRTVSKAEDIARDLGAARIQAIEWSNGNIAGNHLEGADILINTTVLGMEGQEPLSVNIEALQPHAIVYDIVYAPLMTELLKAAQMRDLKIVTGIGMLLNQARPAFEAWFGVMPYIDDEVVKIVREAI